MIEHTLSGIKKTDTYSLYSSPYIIAKQDNILISSLRAHDRFKSLFNNASSTLSYKYYNIFSISAGDPHYYTIFQQVVAAVRDRIGDNRPLWMEAWLNYHKENEVLDWHEHSEEYILHGYVSLDPKHTATEFKSFTVDNKVGNIYVGKTGPEYSHAVKILQPYNGYRITLAFDIKECGPECADNISFIPI